jgi:Uma2 family endonuclease
MEGRHMTRIIQDYHFRLPANLTSLEAFCRWARSREFPRHGRFAYLRGVVWGDFSMEQAFSHNLPKGRINAVLSQLVEERDLGYYFPDGMFLSSAEADLATVPDGVFVSYEAVRSGRVRLLNGDENNAIELSGAPDMVLEMVSKTSEDKDTEDLRRLYWEAGIPEYWLVDARTPVPRFDLLRRGPRGYVATRKQAGWVRSPTFGLAFQLLRDTDPLGHPRWRFHVRPD